MCIEWSVRQVALAVATAFGLASAAARAESRLEPEPPLKTTFANTFPAPFAGHDKEVEVEAGKLRFQSVVSATGFGGVAVGVIPGLVMPRIDASISRANFVTAPGGSSSMVGPLWRLRLSLLGNVKYRSGDLTTEAGGQAVGLSLCYSPYFDTRGLGVVGCFEVGAEAMFLRTTDASGKARPFRSEVAFHSVFVRASGAHWFAAGSASRRYSQKRPKCASRFARDTRLPNTRGAGSARSGPCSRCPGNAANLCQV